MLGELVSSARGRLGTGSVSIGGIFFFFEAASSEVAQSSFLPSYHPKYGVEPGIFLDPDCSVALTCFLEEFSYATTTSPATAVW